MTYKTAVWFAIICVCLMVYALPSVKCGSSHRATKNVIQTHQPIERSIGTEGQIRSCIKLRQNFETAARLTSQPVELLIGLATIESGGCKNLSNGKATGIMQIAFPDGKHLTRAANVVGVSVTNFDHRHNQLHNAVLRAIMLQDYTHRFGNLADGLEAYNQGPSKVEVGDHSAYPDYVVRVLAAAELVHL